MSLEEVAPSKKQPDDRTSHTQEGSPHLEDIASIEIQSATSSKRRRGLVDYMKESGPQKRTKRSAPVTGNAPSASASSSRRQKPPPFRQPNRMPSPDLVPDSDEEVEQAIQRDPDAQSSNSNSKQASAEEDSLFDGDESDSVSRPRLGTRSSRVKIHEEPNVIIPAGQISAKKRAFEQKGGKSGSTNARTTTSSASQAKRSSPRRNKTTSSLLTADKRGLKTIKGKRAPKEVFDVDAMDMTPPEPVPPPKPEELLTLAGLDADDAEELEDFPEDTQPEPTADPALKEAKADADRTAKLKEAKDNLFPASASTVVGSGQEWKAPTIFGL